MFPSNHKTFWNSKQDVAWQVQCYPTPGTASGLLLHMVRSQPQTWSCSFFFPPMNMNIIIFLNHTWIQIQLWCKPKFSVQTIWKTPQKGFISFFPWQWVLWWSVVPSRSSCQLYWWRIGGKLKSQEVFCAPNKSNNLLYLFSSSTQTPTSWTALPLPFLLRWLVASCSLSWTLVWVFNQ